MSASHPSPAISNIYWLLVTHTGVYLLPPTLDIVTLREDICCHACIYLSPESVNSIESHVYDAVLLLKTLFWPSLCGGRSNARPWGKKGRHETHADPVPLSRPVPNGVLDTCVAVTGVSSYLDSCHLGPNKPSSAPCSRARGSRGP